MAWRGVFQFLRGNPGKQFPDSGRVGIESNSCLKTVES